MSNPDLNYCTGCGEEFASPLGKFEHACNKSLHQKFHKKQIVLVASRSLHYFLNEIPSRFNEDQKITVYRNGRVETNFSSYRFIRGPNDLRGFHGIKFEVWGPQVNWVNKEENLHLIRLAEMP